MNKMHISLLYIQLLFLLACNAQDYFNVPVKGYKGATLKLEHIVESNEIIWGMDFLPGGDLIFTTKSGMIFRYANNKQYIIRNAPKVLNSGQGGMLDIKCHPNYSENGWIYMTYSSKEDDSSANNTTLARSRIKNDAFFDFQELYKATPNSSTRHHYGSRIQFDSKNYIYFTIGDRGDRQNNPQDITRDCGKLYRLRDDGNIPEDNPFINIKNAKSAIYSYGHRNPQGLFYNKDTDEIWLTEHGPRGGDEINIIKKGANYGWPLASYGINYDGSRFTEYTELPNTEQPIFAWVPSIAPSGMLLVNSDNYTDINNTLLVGSLSFQYLEQLVVENKSVVSRNKLFDGIGRVRDIKQSPKGDVFISVENKGIFRIKEDK